MREKCVNLQPASSVLTNPNRQLFAIYGQKDQSPVLVWLPIFLGLIASAIVALILCPVPRSLTVSPAKALLLAITDVGATVAIGIGVIAASCTIVARGKLRSHVWGVWRPFASVAAWIAPVIAFYRRDSLWAVAAVFVFSAFSSQLINRYHLTINTPAMASADHGTTDLSHSRRLIFLTFTALLLQLGAICLLASVARIAAILIGGALVMILLFFQTATAFDRAQRQPRLSKARLHLSITLGFAIILVAASLTPYLAVPPEGESIARTGVSSEHSAPKSTRTSSKPNPSILRFAGSWFRTLLASGSQSSTGGGQRGGSMSGGLRPYPALQALFGAGESATESNSLQKLLRKGQLTTLVADDSFHGVILRPKSEERVMVTPPSPTRRIFDGKPTDNRVDPVSIPFYGAYWFYRTSDKTLPPDSVESRGDPASMSFKTTDYSPMSMEARQNFGSPIDLSCCRAIEVVISNGDRRPGTVRVELILTNTTLPGRPHQSLGIVPVNSTLHWFPGDARPPVTEVLTFTVPAQTTIQSFDEAAIRFELRSPRDRWSAMIAIQKFRMIPRAF